MLFSLLLEFVILCFAGRPCIMRNILVSAQLLLYAVFCPGFAEALIRSTSMLANVIEREYK